MKWCTTSFFLCQDPPLETQSCLSVSPQSSLETPSGSFSTENLVKGDIQVKAGKKANICTRGLQQ